MTGDEAGMPNADASEKMNSDGVVQSRKSSTSSARQAQEDSHDRPGFEGAGRSTDASSNVKSNEEQVSERPTSPKSPVLPSHSPLVFANYPPLWTPQDSNKPKSSSQERPPAQPKPERSRSGFSAATLSAVMSAGSKSDSHGKRFKDKDPNNRHEYLQEPDRKTTSHARLNIFGRDIGGLGKPPSLGFGRKKK